MKVSCDQCKFWKHIPDSSVAPSGGYCRRFPPIQPSMGQGNQHPVTRGMTGAGSFTT